MLRRKGTEAGLEWAKVKQEGDADSRGVDFAGSLAQVAPAKAYLAQRHGAVARGAAQRSMQGEVTRKVTSIDVGWR